MDSPPLSPTSPTSSTLPNPRIAGCGEIGGLPYLTAFTPAVCDGEVGGLNTDPYVAGSPMPTSQVAGCFNPQGVASINLGAQEATPTDLEEHKSDGKKRKRSKKSSDELQGEHKETNKGVMKSSTSTNKRKATEQMSTNPAPSLKKKRRSKQPSPGSLLVHKDKKPSPGSLPIDKHKNPSLSKKMVRSPIMNNVVVSSLERRGKKAKSLESSPSHLSLLALSPNVANPGSRKPLKLKSKIWNEVEPIYVDGILTQGRCVHCNELFPAYNKSGTSHIGKHLEVCKEKDKIDGMLAQI